MNFEEFINRYEIIRSEIKKYNSININNIDKKNVSFRNKINDFITDFINIFYFIDVNTKTKLYYNIFSNLNKNLFERNYPNKEISLSDISILFNKIIFSKEDEKKIQLLLLNIALEINKNENIKYLNSYCKNMYNKEYFLKFVNIIMNEINLLIESDLIPFINKKYKNITKNNYKVIFNGGNVYHLIYYHIMNILIKSGDNNILNKYSKYLEYFKHSDIDFDFIIIRNDKEDIKEIDYINEIFILYCISKITDKIKNKELKIIENEVFPFNTMHKYLKEFFYIILLCNLNNFIKSNNLEKEYGYFNGLIFVENDEDLIKQNYTDVKFIFPYNICDIDTIQTIKKRSVDLYNDMFYNDYINEQPFNKKNNLSLLFKNKKDISDNFDVKNYRSYNDLSYLDISNYNSSKNSNFYNISHNAIINEKGHIMSDNKSIKSNFTLSRLKLKMILYSNFGSIEKPDLFNYYNSYQGELIDLNYIYYNDDTYDYMKQTKHYNVVCNKNTYQFEAPSLYYIIEQLMYILYKFELFPWNNNKYLKRLKRTLFLLIFIKSKDLNEISSFKYSFKDNECNIYNENNFNLIYNIIYYLLSIIDYGIFDYNDIYNRFNNVINEKIKDPNIIKYIKLFILFDCYKFIYNNNNFKEYLINLKNTLKECKEIYDYLFENNLLNELDLTNLDLMNLNLHD